MVIGYGLISLPNILFRNFICCIFLFSESGSIIHTIFYAKERLPKILTYSNNLPDNLNKFSSAQDRSTHVSQRYLNQKISEII